MRSGCRAGDRSSQSQIAARSTRRTPKTAATSRRVPDSAHRQRQTASPAPTPFRRSDTIPGLRYAPPDASDRCTRRRMRQPQALPRRCSQVAARRQVLEPNTAQAMPGISRRILASKSNTSCRDSRRSRPPPTGPPSFRRRDRVLELSSFHSFRCDSVPCSRCMLHAACGELPLHEMLTRLRSVQAARFH